MAIYHLSAQIISRSSGGSAVAAAAYRTGERLHDERTGITHDYSRRKDKIPDVFVMAPESAPGWVHDQGKLWNAVEAAERRKDAQLSREVNVALPLELKPEEQVGLLREHVQDAYVSCGMVAGVAVHVHDAKNPHAHIMLTTRDIGPEGFGKKNRSWNDREMLETQRKQWAEACNRYLSRAGHEIRIDHRSLSAQGIEREPTIHQGVHATAVERRIEQARKSGRVLAFPLPERCVRNREIVERNEQVRGISAKITDMASARKRIEAERTEAEKEPRDAEREILQSVLAVNAKLRAPTDETRKQMEAEKERAGRGAAGDFVQDRLKRKVTETVRKEPAVPSSRGPRPVGDDPARRVYIEVPYKEKDAAKASGAKFDRDKKQWYVPPGVDMAAFAKWAPGAGSKGAPERRRRLENPYTQPRKDAEDAMHRAHFAWEEAAQPHCDKIKADVQRRDKLFYAARGVKEKLEMHERSGFFARLIRRGEKNDLQEKLMRIEEELGAIPETNGIYYDYCTLYNDRVRAMIEPIMAREHPGLAERWTRAIERRDEIKKQEEDWSVKRRHELDEAVSMVSCHLSKDPRFNPRGAFEDQERFEIAEGLIRERIDKGERFEGPEDPKLEKVKEKANKMQLEQELGWSR